MQKLHYEEIQTSAIWTAILQHSSLRDNPSCNIGKAPKHSKKPTQEPTPNTKNHQKAIRSREDKQVTRSHKIAHGVL